MVDHITLSFINEIRSHALLKKKKLTQTKTLEEPFIKKQAIKDKHRHFHSHKIWLKFNACEKLKLKKTYPCSYFQHILARIFLFHNWSSKKKKKKTKKKTKTKTQTKTARHLLQSSSSSFILLLPPSSSCFATSPPSSVWAKRKQWWVSQKISHSQQIASPWIW